MAGMNKVLLIGNLGQDPEIVTLPSGDVLAKFSLATSSSWRDKQSNEKKEHTEWHRIVLRGGAAKVAQQYLKKGNSVHLEGSNRTRKWTDAQGIERYTTEVHCRELLMLGKSNQSQSNQSQNQSSYQHPPAQQQAPGGQWNSQQNQTSTPAYGGGGGSPSSMYEDDIPFGAVHYIAGC